MATRSGRLYLVVASAVAVLLVSVAAATVLPQRGMAPGQTIVYYVAADEVAWDYAPSGMDQLAGTDFESATDTAFQSGLLRYFNVRGDYHPAGGARGIGRVYRKVLYREYTDSTFTELKPRPPEWEHLGFMGPMLRGTVGDTLRVVFRNNADRPYSMHPHGVFYDKDSEGTPYEDGTAGADKADDAVTPGGTHVYTWSIPERAGPGPSDPSSIMWMYHSHVDEHRDINTGLMGPMIVTARGQAGPDGRPTDVDREFVMTFMDGEETSSWLIHANVETYIEGMTPAEAAEQPAFFLSNVMPSVNGWLYGNMPPLRIYQGERVRWYVMAGTNGFDFHTPHWHGHTVLAHHSRTDVISVEPMMMVHADMEADNPGTWFFHCHVAPHLEAGMATRFTVLPASERPIIAEN